MVSSQTIHARDKKQAEQKRLIGETEKEVGKKEDHPEDDLILNTRYIATIVGTWLMSSPEEIVAYLKSKKEGWTCRRVLEAYVRSQLRLSWVVG